MCNQSEARVSVDSRMTVDDSTPAAYESVVMVRTASKDKKKTGFFRSFTQRVGYDVVENYTAGVDDDLDIRVSTIKQDFLVESLNDVEKDLWADLDDEESEESSSSKTSAPAAKKARVSLWHVRAGAACKKAQQQTKPSLEQSRKNLKQQKSTTWDVERFSVCGESVNRSTTRWQPVSPLTQSVRSLGKSLKSVKSRMFEIKAVKSVKSVKSFTSKSFTKALKSKKQGLAIRNTVKPRFSEAIKSSRTVQFC